MNAMDLIYGLNNVQDSYVASAGAFRQRKTKHLPKRKLWLIAALIALTLLLVGCAVVYVLRLQDMAFGQETHEVLGSGVQNRTMLSLQGVKGTPGYQATKEWYEWLQSYDPDDTIYHSPEAFSEDFGDDYYAYSLYTRDMKNKLDEICAKHNLKLLGKMYVDPDEAAACKALGIQGILRPGAQAETHFGSVRYYADGSFFVEGCMTLTGSDSVWPYEEIVSYSCGRKDSFNQLYASVGPVGTYEEWTYTTSGGVDVLIVLEQRNEMNQPAFMIADRGDYVFVFSTLEYDRDWTKEALEAYAEVFDFTVQPQPVSQEALAEAQTRREATDAQYAEDYDRRMHAYTALGYDARIKSRMEFSTHPSQLGFCVTDLDGNGTEELIVGENGYIITVYSARDGGTQYLMPPVFAFEGVVSESDSFLMNMGEQMGYNSYVYLCQDNVLAYVTSSVNGIVSYYFAKPENGTYTWINGIVYYPSEGQSTDSPWSMIPDMTSPHIKVPITEEKFNEIVRSHPRIPLALTPISQFPLADNSPSGIGGEDKVYTSYNALFAGLFAPERWRYSFIDLDGDGQEELFLTQGAWKGVLTVKNGKVKILECGKQVSICRGNYILHTQTYLDGNSATSVYKMQNGSAVLVDYLRYDKDANPETPWFYGIDAQDSSLQPVSQQQYEAILAKYVPLELEMKTVTG